MLLEGSLLYMAHFWECIVCGVERASEITTNQKENMNGIEKKTNKQSTDEFSQ